MRFLALAALTLASPQATLAAEEAKATEEQKVEARAALNACLINNASKFDDQKSDASTIGRALSDACADDLISAANIYSRGSNERTKRIFRQRFLEQGPDIATSIVLRLRAGG